MRFYLRLIIYHFGYNMMNHENIIQMLYSLDILTAFKSYLSSLPIYHAF